MNPSHVPCSVCNEGGHHARNCPALTEPLKPGFFAPTGGRNYGGDEEDEKLVVVCTWKRNGRPVIPVVRSLRF